MSKTNKQRNHNKTNCSHDFYHYPNENEAIPTTNLPVLIDEFEHLIRAAIVHSETGRRNCLNAIKQVVRYVEEQEETIQQDLMEAVDNGLSEHNTFLRAKINTKVQKSLETDIENRTQFFSNIRSTANDELEKALELINGFDIDPSSKEIISQPSGIHLKPVLLFSRNEIPDYECPQHDTLDHLALEDTSAKDKKAFARICEFPIETILIESKGSGSLYPMLPWHGVMSCTCGSKLYQAHQFPICKHEFAALLLAGKADLQLSLSEITNPRHRRLVHPEPRMEFLKIKQKS